MSHDDIVKQALDLASKCECYITLNGIRPNEVSCLHVAEGVEQITVRKMYGEGKLDYSPVTIKFLPF